MLRPLDRHGRRGVLRQQERPVAVGPKDGGTHAAGKRASVAGAAASAPGASKYTLPKSVVLESAYLRGLGEAKDEQA